MYIIVYLDLKPLSGLSNVNINRGDNTRNIRIIITDVNNINIVRNTVTDFMVLFTLFKDTYIGLNRLSLVVLISRGVSTFPPSSSSSSARSPSSGSP